MQWSCGNHHISPPVLINSQQRRFLAEPDSVQTSHEAAVTNPASNMRLARQHMPERKLTDDHDASKRSTHAPAFPPICSNGFKADGSPATTPGRAPKDRPHTILQISLQKVAQLRCHSTPKTSLAEPMQTSLNTPGDEQTPPHMLLLRRPQSYAQCLACIKYPLQQTHQTHRHSRALWNKEQQHSSATHPHCSTPQPAANVP
jgi:hypothetical protein